MTKDEKQILKRKDNSKPCKLNKAVVATLFSTIGLALVGMISGFALKMHSIIKQKEILRYCGYFNIPVQVRETDKLMYIKQNGESQDIKNFENAMNMEKIADYFMAGSKISMATSGLVTSSGLAFNILEKKEKGKNDNKNDNEIEKVKPAFEISFENEKTYGLHVD